LTDKNNGCDSVCTMHNKSVRCLKWCSCCCCCSGTSEWLTHVSIPEQGWTEKSLASQSKDGHKIFRGPPYKAFWLAHSLIQVQWSLSTLRDKRDRQFSTSYLDELINLINSLLVASLYCSPCNDTEVWFRNFFAKGGHLKWC